MGVSLSLSLSFSLSVSFYALEGPAKTLAEVFGNAAGLFRMKVAGWLCGGLSLSVAFYS